MRASGSRALFHLVAALAAGVPMKLVADWSARFKRVHPRLISIISEMDVVKKTTVVAAAAPPTPPPPSNKPHRTSTTEDNNDWITTSDNGGGGGARAIKHMYTPIKLLRRFASTRRGHDYRQNITSTTSECSHCGNPHTTFVRLNRNKLNTSLFGQQQQQACNNVATPSSSRNSINSTTSATSSSLASSSCSTQGDDADNTLTHLSDDDHEDNLDLREFDHRFKPLPLTRHHHNNNTNKNYLTRDPLAPFKSQSFRNPLKRLSTFVQRYKQRPLLNTSTTSLVISASYVCPSCDLSPHNTTSLTPSLDKSIEYDIAEIACEMESMESVQDRSNPKERFIIDGRKKFNRDPKLGLKYLIDNNCLSHTEKDISQFLFNGEGLNKTVIGNYLGEKCDFNIAVLQEFVRLHEFRNQKLVPALRDFLWSFRLPGESQKIDRMMESFAIRYCEINPTIFTHHDLCYKLSFLIIMLNTLLHNPSVKEKTSIEDFITMSGDIDPDGELNRDLMIDVYNSIKKEPFKIPVDDGDDIMLTFFNPDREGWLSKQGNSSTFSGRYRTWKRRWFILKDKCLYYFEFTTDKEPKGIIPLENIKICDVPDKNNSKFCFELQSTSKEVIKACKTDSEGKVVEGKHTVYRMSAGSSKEKEDWMHSIRASISTNPIFKRR